MEGSPACPFIAYEDERDERSAEPDHAHRCYAEVRPAPRALAHQEAYCLSSAFPVCPTFQAWARRESAQARATANANAVAGAGAAASGAAMTAAGAGGAGTTPVGPGQDGRDEAATAAGRTASSSGPSTGGSSSGDDSHDRAGDDRREPSDAEFDQDLDEDGIADRRNPPRDWAAPPPWASGAAAGAAATGVGGVSARPADASQAPGFLASRTSEGQGLAGSSADRLAGGASAADLLAPTDVTPPPAPVVPSRAPSAPADPELAGLVGGAAAWSPGPVESSTQPPPGRSSKRPAVSSTRARTADRNVDRTPVQSGPAWEKARRYEAYPTIRTRTGMPNIPRVVLLAGALGIAALALFFLPALLGMGGKGTPAASATPPASAALESGSPTASVAAPPSSQVYVVKSGDNFTKIAKKFGLTVEQLKAANPQIKDINKIAVGDQINIPAPPSDVVPGASPTASAVASPSP